MDFSRRLGFALSFVVASLAAHAQSTVPAQTQAIPSQSASVGGAPLAIDLRNYFTVPGVTGQVAQFDTVLGKFNIELFGNDAPLSVANFLNYTNAGGYNNTIIHRSEPLGANNGNRILQGGGYDPSGAAIARNAPIALEYKLPNVRGTLALARGSDLNSATSEWFFNVDDNTSVLGASNNGGYAVFARVLGTGMSIVDAIAAVPTFDARGGNLNSPFGHLPLRNVTAGQQTIVDDNFIKVTSVTAIPMYPTAASTKALIEFAVINGNDTIVSAALSGSSLVITPLATGTATLAVRAADTNNNAVSSTNFTVTVSAAASAPVIARQPASQTIATGSTAAFNVIATGVPTPNYQWKFNGADIAGATGARLVLPKGTAQAGSYSVVVSNASGSVTSNVATLTQSGTTDVGRLTNLSVLADLTFDDPSFTVGTVVGGGTNGATKPLLVREVGPSLAAVGLTSGFLADPIFSLADGASRVIGGNDDWGSDTTLAATFARLGAFAFTSATSKDAALYQPALAPGNYTVIVGSPNRAAGKVLAEVYDATPGGTFGPATPRLLDISVLKQIASGGSMTAGFVIGGSTSRTVLVRAIGPGLAALGVPAASALGDPFVELFDGASIKILENDNWGGDPQITAANTSVGAFAVSNLASKDAILLVTLAPGNYTARVSGVAGSSGLAVVEVYDVP